jgi:hypothetical protein
MTANRKPGSRAGFLFAIVMFAVMTPPPAAGALPEPPREYIDTSYVTPTGRVISVSTGGDLQGALNTAQAGDVIELQAGTTYSGRFQLPNRPGSNWITIRSSRYAELPPPGTRVGPEHAPLMAKLVPAHPTEPAIITQTGAHHYRLTGLEVTASPGAGQMNNALIILDSAHYEGSTYVRQTSLDQVPHHIIIDRSYIHGAATGEYVRGVVLNSAHTAIIDSYLAEFHTTGSDTQAAVGWNGPGPFKLVNNYLQAAGENLMFGGAVAHIPGLIPSDVEIRGNHFHKPLSWFPQDPSYAGTKWVVKNLLECKSGQRWLIEGNLFENHWAGAQSGWFFMSTPKTQVGQNPWNVCSDLTFRYNWIRRTTAGIALSGTDGYASQRSGRIAIQHNVFEGLGANVVAGAHNGVAFMPSNGILDLVIDHNTIFNTSTVLLFTGVKYGAMTGFVFQNNILNAAGYGIFGDGAGAGTTALNTYAPGWSVRRNLLAGPKASTLFPVPDTFYVPSMDAAGFADLAAGDYELRDGNQYREAGTDREALGAASKSVPAVSSIK